MEEIRPSYPVVVPGVEVQDPDGAPGTMIPWEIVMYAPNPAQAMVIGRVTLESANGKADEAAGLNLVALYRIMIDLIVEPLDKVTLESKLLSEEIPPGVALGLVIDVVNIHQAVESENKAPTTGPVRRVRAKK